MVSKIELILSTEHELSYQMASLFHGALMELLPLEYVSKMHISQLHPFTQHLEHREGGWVWIISCLNEEADRIIIKETVENLSSIELKKKQIMIHITDKTYRFMTDQELLEVLYAGEGSGHFTIRFRTPTAFKQQGRYVFYPDIRCIFQSIMNKYDAAEENQIMSDEDTLQQLSEKTRIVSYNLKSVKFSLEGIKIPAFIGTVTMKVSGAQTMINFAKLLFLYGTYSGVGIKSALGMGSMEILSERGRKCLQTDK